MQKYIKVFILLILLTLLEVSTSTNSVSFSIIKSFGIILIVGWVKSYTKKYDTVIPIAMILLLTPSAFAVDNTVYNVSSISRTTMTGSEAPYFIFVNSNASASGSVDSAPLTAGYLTPRSIHMVNSTSVWSAVIDHVTPATSGYRIFGTDKAGNVFYWSTNDAVDYSDGFYTCCNIFGDPTNSNPLYKIGTLSTSDYPRKIAIDSSGNVYTHDVGVIVRYVKELDYTQQTFYTLVSGTDYKPSTAPTINVGILDLRFDASDNLHVLVGSRSSGTSGTRQGYLSYTIINPSGVRVTSNLAIQNDTCSCTLAGFEYGGLVIDATNPAQNYTYAYKKDGAGTFGLTHNSSTGNTTVATLTGITSLMSIEYYNNQIYLTSPVQNLIRSYATNYEGLFIEGAGQASQLTYVTKTINSVETSYAINQPVDVTYVLSIFPFTSPMTFNSFTVDYRYEIDMYDENGGKFATYNMPASQFVETGNFLDGYGADASGTVTFTHAGNWTTGNQTAKLWEIRTSVNTKSLLDTASISLTSNTTDSTNITIDVPITTGSGVTTLNQWDLYVSYLGWGVNPISKLFFALMVITIVGLIGMKLTNGDTAMVGAFAPYIFFTYIEYIPKWIFIILIIMLILKSKVFR